MFKLIKDKRVVYGVVITIAITINWVRFFYQKNGLNTLQEEDPELYDEIKDDINNNVTIYYDLDNKSLPRCSFIFPFMWKRIIINKQSTKSLTRFILHHEIKHTKQFTLVNNNITYAAIFYPFVLFYENLQFSFTLFSLILVKMSEYDADIYSLKKLSLEDLLELDNENLQNDDIYHAVFRYHHTYPNLISLFNRSGLDILDSHPNSSYRRALLKEEIKDKQRIQERKLREIRDLEEQKICSLENQKTLGIFIKNDNVDLLKINQHLSLLLPNNF